MTLTYDHNLANAFDGTFVFFATAQTNAKNPKEPPSNRTKDSRQWTAEPRQKKNNEGITAPTQKAGFGVPKTVLWLMEV